MGLEQDKRKKRRWIVLLPESLVEDRELVHKIYWKAMRQKIDVFYLILNDNFERYLQVRRAMATTTAQISNAEIKLEWDVCESNQYIQKLKQIVQEGDVVVCREEHRVKSGLLKTEPIGQYIHNRENMQVMTLSGFFSEKQKMNKARVKGFLSLFWALCILVFFSVLEIQMDLALVGVSRKMMIILLICFEAGAFYAWNSSQIH